MPRLLQVAQDAVLAAYRGHRVGCNREDYVAGVRGRLYEACRYLYDEGDEDQAAHVMAEILRLDKQFNHHPQSQRQEGAA